MDYRIGFSSGTFPNLTANEIISVLHNTGSKTIDLRVGKRQRWEEDGIAPFLANNIQIAFIGTSVVLGDEYWDEEQLEIWTRPYQDYSIRVFAKCGCTEGWRRNLLIHQIQILVKILGSTDKILIETHHGYSNVNEILRIHEIAGTHVLLDTMGLARITDDLEYDARRLAPISNAMQVKGFNWSDPEKSLHLPLAQTDIERSLKILNCITKHSSIITIESKAGVPLEDISTLKSMLSHSTRG